MKFYKVTDYKGVEYNKLYDALEAFGDFVIDGDIILFYAKSLKKSNISNLNVNIEEIDASKYKSGRRMSDDWVTENYRKFRVEKLLKKAETEKQEDLSNLYNIIKNAGDIIYRKEDLIDEE